jgi:hypothetical protein
MAKLTLILIAILAYTATGLYFGITAKPFCFDLEQDPGKDLKFYYEVTGEKPE